MGVRGLSSVAKIPPPVRPIQITPEELDYLNCRAIQQAWGYRPAPAFCETTKQFTVPEPVSHGIDTEEIDYLNRMAIDHSKKHFEERDS